MIAIGLRRKDYWKYPYFIKRYWKRAPSQLFSGEYVKSPEQLFNGRPTKEKLVSRSAIIYEKHGLLQSRQSCEWEFAI